MRKKIEELRNREEGFTLVELLAVIVILGIIVAIAIPAIGNVTERARSGGETAEKELAIDAAQLYIVENGVPAATTETATTENKVTKDGNVTSIPVGFLVEKGYLEELNNNSKISSKKVLVTVGGTSENKTYSYKVE